MATYALLVSAIGDMLRADNSNAPSADARDRAMNAMRRYAYMVALTLFALSPLKAEDPPTPIVINSKAHPKPSISVDARSDVSAHIDPSKLIDLKVLFCLVDAKGEWLKMISDVKSVPRWIHASGITRYDDAVSFYSKLIAASPEAELFRRRGEVHREHGELDLALADLDESIRLDSNTAGSYHARGQIYAVKDLHLKAIEDLSNAIRLNPREEWGYLDRARVHQRLRKFDAATSDCTQAIEINPKREFGYQLRAAISIEDAKYDNAIADFGRALQIDPNSTNSLVGRGLAWGEKGEFENTILDCSQAIRFDPRCAIAYKESAIAWLHKEDFARSLTNIAAAFQLDPEVKPSPQVGLEFFQAAKRWMKELDFEKAFEACTVAIRLAPEHAPVYQARGMIYLLRQEHRNAAADFEHAIRFATTSAQKASIHIKLAMALSGLKE